MLSMITAVVPSRKNGKPDHHRRTFKIDRDPEDWGDGRSRIFAENVTVRDANGDYVFAPVVVLTDTIEPAA